MAFFLHRVKRRISLFVAGLIFVQLAIPLQSIVSASEDDADVPYEIVNPGFETGDLTGWTVMSGNAFGPESVSDETTWWAEQIPYHQEGSYHLNGWRRQESSTGVLRSSIFRLGGSGWISFKLGGGKHTDKMHINVVEADTGNIIAKFGNTEFADINFPHVDQGMRLANMVQYKADLSMHIGKHLYLEIVDNAVEDWGVLFADAFHTCLAAEPLEGVTAINLQPPDISHEIINPGFETGNMAGWTVVSGGAFGPDSVSGDTVWWSEQIPYNQDGAYHLNGWKYPESETGIVRSSTFVLGGSGWITFKLGGGKNPDKVYINIVEAHTGKIVARYANSRFSDVGFPDPAKGMRLANMEQYKADLSEHLGKHLYIEIVDNATSDWGLIFADAFYVYHESEPSEGVLAIDIKPDFDRYQIQNPSFETGDLTGWTIVSGGAFGPDSVSDETMFWSEQIPYNQEGLYHLNGWRYPEEETGILRSSTFELGGSGWISFRLGGGKNSDQVYINVVDADTGRLIARYGNSEFSDQNFPYPEQGLRIANMELYRADLSRHIGKKLYLEIVDNAASDWGVVFADAFHTFHETAPSEGVYAIDISPAELENPGFETGNLAGWTVEGGAFSVTDADHDKKEGTFYAASSMDGTGAITSTPFRIGGAGLMTFTILDIRSPSEAYVALYDADTGELLKKTADAAPGTISWGIQEHYGKVVYVKVVDASDEAYIAVDDFRTKITGPIVHFGFDETSGKTAAESVRGREHEVHYVFNDARFMNSKDPRWTDHGVKNGALLFDGYSNFIEIDADEVVPVGDALTIEAWVAPRSYEWGDGGKLSAIVNQHDEDRNEGFALGMYRHGSWSFQAGIGGRWIQVWVNDHPLEKYKWNHVAAAFDKEAGMIKLYLNGEEVASQSTPKNVPITPSSENLMIGKHNKPVEFAGVFSFNMFSGLIDELTIYNEAIPAETIKAHYESVKALHGGAIPVIPGEAIDEDPRVFDGDLHRPQYHAIPPQNWMNEAHAPIYYNGKYHLFYQHNPQGPYWHQIHWGHWVSDDMVHWEHVRPALAPERGDLDPDGVWSGGATYDRDGRPVLFYTAGNDALSPNQRVAIATPADPSDPYQTGWIKHPMPVVEQNNNGIHNEFRDPFVWYDEEVDKWYMLVTSGLKDYSSGTAFVYVSDDLYNWEFKGPLYVSDRSKYPELGTVWELPVLLPIGTDSQGNEKHIFIINPHEKPEHVPPSDDVLRDVEVFYWIGTWDRDNFRFIPDQEAPTKMDLGDGYLTAESGLVTPDGRTVVFSMVQNVRTPQAEYLAGWAHNLALPVALSLDEHDELRIEPIEELQGLRGNKVADIRDKNLQEANALIRHVKGDMLEILMEIEPGDAQKFGIKVRRSERGEEETLIYYDKTDQTFNVDRTKSSTDPDARVDGIQGGYVELGDDENLILHIFLDRSVVEAFANYKKKLTTRVYVGRYDSLGLQVWADGEISVKSMEVWEMNALTGEPAAPVYVPDNWDNSVYPDITDLPNHDFATGDLTGWISEGDAFQDEHVTDAMFFWGNIYYNPSRKIPGGYHLIGFNEALGGDSLTGTLRTQEFVLGGNGKIDFLVSGGRDIDNLYVALVRVSDGKELFKVTGFNYEEFQRIVWDASAYIGERLYIKIVDNSTAPFGHLNVDDFHVPVKVTSSSAPSSAPPVDGNPGFANPRPDGEDRLVIDLKDGEPQVLLPADAEYLDGRSRIVLSRTDVELEIPAEVLRELRGLVANEELAGAQISIGLNALAADAVNELLERAASGVSAAIRAASEIFDLHLAIMTREGKSLKLETFPVPIKIKLHVRDGADHDLIGMYHITDDGKLTYIGGALEGGMMGAYTDHCSKYAVLEYDKAYRDVDERHWAYSAIRKMSAKHIVTGINDHLFAPDNKVTRSEFAAMIARALGLKAESPASFKDVDSSKWHAEAIAAAYEAGIVEGRNDGTFAPDAAITRQEMAAMLMRAYACRTGGKAESAAESGFADRSQISAWAREAVDQAARLGVLKGRGNNRFDPLGLVVRAESVQAVANLLDVS
jgi:sucrose-6-phosphate hydrolase SacC (GH32 family)